MTTSGHSVKFQPTTEEWRLLTLIRDSTGAGNSKILGAALRCLMAEIEKAAAEHQKKTGELDGTGTGIDTPGVETGVVSDDEGLAVTDGLDTTGVNSRHEDLVTSTPTDTV